MPIEVIARKMCSSGARLTSDPLQSAPGTYFWCERVSSVLLQNFFSFFLSFFLFGVVSQFSVGKQFLTLISWGAM
jgi:hypothetical protein